MAESYCLGSNPEATFFFVFFFPLIVHKTRVSLGHYKQRSSRARGLKFYTATQEVIRNRKQHLSEFYIFSTGHDTSFKLFFPRVKVEVPWNSFRVSYVGPLRLQRKKSHFLAFFFGHSEIVNWIKRSINKF